MASGFADFVVLQALGLSQDQVFELAQAGLQLWRLADGVLVAREEELAAHLRPVDSLDIQAVSDSVASELEVPHAESSTCMSINDVMAATGLSRSTVSREIQSGRLRARQVNKCKRLIQHTDFDAWLSQRRQVNEGGGQLNSLQRADAIRRAMGV